MNEWSCASAVYQSQGGIRGRIQIESCKPIQMGYRHSVQESPQFISRYELLSARQGAFVATTHFCFALRHSLFCAPPQPSYHCTEISPMSMATSSGSLTGL